MTAVLPAGEREQLIAEATGRPQDRLPWIPPVMRMRGIPAVIGAIRTVVSIGAIMTIRTIGADDHDRWRHLISRGHRRRGHHDTLREASQEGRPHGHHDEPSCEAFHRQLSSSA
jgi:hypothetical protein